MPNSGRPASQMSGSAANSNGIRGNFHRHNLAGPTHDEDPTELDLYIIYPAMKPPHLAFRRLDPQDYPARHACADSDLMYLCFVNVK